MYGSGVHEVNYRPVLAFDVEVLLLILLIEQTNIVGVMVKNRVPFSWPTSFHNFEEALLKFSSCIGWVERINLGNKVMDFRDV